jgi:hypothetical protein
VQSANCGIIFEVVLAPRVFDSHLDTDLRDIVSAVSGSGLVSVKTLQFGGWVCRESLQKHISLLEILCSYMTGFNFRAGIVWDPPFLPIKAPLNIEPSCDRDVTTAQLYYAACMCYQLIVKELTMVYLQSYPPGLE